MTLDALVTSPSFSSCKNFGTLVATGHAFTQGAFLQFRHLDAIFITFCADRLVIFTFVVFAVLLYVAIVTVGALRLTYVAPV